MEELASSTARAEFEDHYVTATAAAAQVDKSAVSIVDIRAGSVVVVSKIEVPEAEQESFAETAATSFAALLTTELAVLSDSYGGVSVTVVPAPPPSPPSSPAVVSISGNSAFAQGPSGALNLLAAVVATLVLLRGADEIAY